VKAALDEQRAALDARVAEAAAGNTRPGEYFPQDMRDQWAKARALKQQQVETFRTGPQSALFRTGADGLPTVNGGELAPKFFNASAGQSADIAGFNRVATPETRGLLRNYAIRDAADQTDKLGNLTNAKFNSWLDDRSGALRGLFDEGQRAQLGQVGANVRRADEALDLGMGRNSATMKNLLSLGALYNPLVSGVAKNIPFIGRFTGPVLDALKASASKDQIGRLSALMADPAALEAALARIPGTASPLSLGRAAPLVGVGARALPLLSQ